MAICLTRPGARILADLLRDRGIIEPQGGSSAGGTAGPIPNGSILPRGGCRIGGTAGPIPNGSILPLGGSSAGGAATLSWTHLVNPVGGSSAGGTAGPIPNGSILPLGGSSAGGAAPVPSGSAIAGTGGSSAGGTADVTVPVEPSSQGPLNASGSTQDGTGTGWNDVSYALACDGTYCESTLGFATTTSALVLSMWGFTLPPAATVVGIEVRVRWYSYPAGGCIDALVQLTSPFTGNSADKANLLPVPSDGSYTTYGGPLDTWGVSWSGSTPNEAAFALWLKGYCLEGSGAIVGVDCATIQIWYVE